MVEVGRDFCSLNQLNFLFCPDNSVSAAILYVSDIASIAFFARGASALRILFRLRRPLFPQQFLEHAHALVHVLFLQQEGRQET